LEFLEAIKKTSEKMKQEGSKKNLYIGVFRANKKRAAIPPPKSGRGCPIFPPEKIL
jgi:hypothetical protein